MYIEHVHTHKIGAVFNFIVLTHRQVKCSVKNSTYTVSRCYMYKYVMILLVYVLQVRKDNRVDEKQGYGEMILSEGDSVSFEEETDGVKSPHMHSSPCSSTGAEKVSKAKAGQHGMAGDAVICEIFVVEQFSQLSKTMKIKHKYFQHTWYSICMYMYCTCN